MKLSRRFTIRVYNHSYHETVSGGSVIAAEFSRAWTRNGHRVTVSTNPGAEAFFLSRGIPPKRLRVASRIPTKYESVLTGSIAHLINAVLDVFFTRDGPADLIFSASWSLQDILPALIDRARHPGSKLAVGCYLLLDPPRAKLYGRTVLHRYAFWAEYLIGIRLTYRYASILWTASPVDAAFVRETKKIPSFAVRGGVDLALSRRAAATDRAVDAISMSRFHPQKNITELLDIWDLVHARLPGATLALIGDGFMKRDILEKIRTLGLSRSVRVLPPIDGQDKFDLLKSAKLFVSASHADTGNLSLDEAMATGTPGIVFDLPKLVYPKGVVRIACFRQDAFAEAVIRLLTHPDTRAELARDARSFGRRLGWEKSAQAALDSVPGL